MSDRSSPTSRGLVVFALAVTAMLWPLPGAQASSETVMISPVAAEFVESDISIFRPAVRRPAAAKALSLGSLNIVQADASGALTVLVESVGLTGDTPTADDNDFTRIYDAVQAVAVLGVGTRVRVMGTFDWSEE